MPKKTKAERAIYNKAYNDAHKEKRKARDKAYYAANREERKAQHKEYLKTPAGIKSNSISHWKYLGIKSNNWELTYERYITSEWCEYCGKIYSNSLDRHLDHNHSIIDSYNIRGVLCRSCNLKDVLG